MVREKKNYVKKKNVQSEYALQYLDASQRADQIKYIHVDTPSPLGR
jgi:hypothetical protein